MSRLDQNVGANKPKSVVSLGPTVEDIRNRETNEESGMPDGPIKTAASYGERARSRQQATQAIKKGGKPLGGAPPIPSEKLHKLADGMVPKPNFGSEEEQLTEIPRTPKEPPPDFKGVGSAYRVNQEMAKGNVDRPVSMKEAKEMTAETRKEPEAQKSLSPDTVAALEEAKRQADSAPTISVEEREEDLENADKEIADGDSGFDMDYAGIAEARGILLSKKRKKVIEERLEPLDIADMIMKREIQQTIPVIPAKLNYTMRTFNQHEHLFCLQYVFDMRGSQVYAEELLNTCKLVCSLVAINGAQLPEHRKDVGTAKETIDKVAFEKKMFHVASFPTQMIADISVQAIWFTERVNKLFSLDEIKNG